MVLPRVSELSGRLLLLLPCAVVDYLLLMAEVGALGGIGRDESDDTTHCFCLQFVCLSWISHRLSSFFTNLFNAGKRAGS